MPILHPIMPMMTSMTAMLLAAVVALGFGVSFALFYNAGKRG